MTQTVLAVSLMALSLFLIVTILLQKGKQAGMSSAIMGGSNDSFFDKNKGRTKDALLAKITIVVASLFIILSITLAFFIK